MIVLQCVYTWTHAYTWEEGGRETGRELNEHESLCFWSLVEEVKGCTCLFTFSLEFLSHLLYSQHILWNMTSISFGLTPCNPGVSFSVIILWQYFHMVCPERSESTAFVASLVYNIVVMQMLFSNSRLSSEMISL